MDGATWVAICFAGLGVQGAAYLLWELGLHRAPASVMGLMAASLPVLSTVALLGMYAVSPQLQTGTATNYTTLMIAAAMIASAVLIGAYKSNGKKPAATSVDHDAARRDSETPLP
jgi:drug/metabolite transporter (DMT)-like permease